MDDAQVTQMEALEMQSMASHRRTRGSSCGFSAASRKTSYELASQEVLADVGGGSWCLWRT
jgi:hypothetical protein